MGQQSETRSWRGRVACFPGAVGGGVVSLGKAAEPDTRPR